MLESKVRTINTDSTGDYQQALNEYQTLLNNQLTQPTSGYSNSWPTLTNTATTGLGANFPLWKSNPIYVELPDNEPGIEHSFKDENTRANTKWIPKVGRRVVFGSKNGVTRSGTVIGISVHSTQTRHVKCDEGNAVFVDFSNSDWYYPTELSTP